MTHPTLFATTTLPLPKSVIRLRLWRNPVLITFALACFYVSSRSQAVTPAPDGGYSGENTAEGTTALFSLTTGEFNTANGWQALYGNTTGHNNTANGAAALESNATGNFNTATGANALFLNSGNDNTANGAGALFDNTTGSQNTASGSSALQKNTNGSDNTATGYQALFNNGFDAMDNTAIGSGALFSNVSASFNTAVGFNALFNNTAGNNTAVGDQALLNNTSGAENTATGAGTLFKNKTGNNNTASGLQALFSNTSGSNNTADGLLALESNTSGHDNTAHGFQALLHSTGSNNIAVGSNAGSSLTTGGNNIDIGANVLGNPGEANTIRLGKQGTQKATFIAGIAGTPITGSTVVVNSTGKLGVATSSARFKEAIKPMEAASEAILALKPVSFHYKEEVDPDRIPQFGLVAEEVAKVDPELVMRDEQGNPFTVRYEAVNAMLLNEFLKEHRKVEELEKQIEALAAAVQKLSDPQPGKGAPQVTANN
jgi:trimeric autotransporter adhesin